MLTTTAWGKMKQLASHKKETDLAVLEELILTFAGDLTGLRLPHRRTVREEKYGLQIRRIFSLFPDTYTRLKELTSKEQGDCSNSAMVEYLIRNTVGMDIPNHWLAGKQETA